MNHSTKECESSSASDMNYLDVFSDSKGPSGKTENSSGVPKTPCDKNVNRKRTADAMLYEDEEGFEGESPEEEEKRLRANHQERNRMQTFNSALNGLRSCIPNHFRLGSRRLSKIRTLRLAINYIAALRDVLNKEQVITPFPVEQTTSHHGHELSPRYHYGNTLPYGERFDDGTLDPPSRISLRDIAERGLSSSHMLTPILQTPNIGLNSWQGRSSLGTSGESSDESFCTEQRVYGNSPDNLAASPFLGSRLYQNYTSSYGHNTSSHPIGNLSQIPHYCNDYDMYSGQQFFGTDKNTNNGDSGLSFSW